MCSTLSRFKCAIVPVNIEYLFSLYIHICIYVSVRFQGAIHDMKMEFNQKVLAMREAKKNAIESIHSNNRLVQEIDSQVFGDDVPKHLADEVGCLFVVARRWICVQIVIMIIAMMVMTKASQLIDAASSSEKSKSAIDRSIVRGTIRCSGQAGSTRSGLKKGTRSPWTI